MLSVFLLVSWTWAPRLRSRLLLDQSLAPTLPDTNVRADADSAAMPPSEDFPTWSSATSES